MFAPIFNEPYTSNPFPPLLVPKTRLEWFATGMACGFCLAILLKSTLTESEKPTGHKNSEETPITKS